MFSPLSYSYVADDEYDARKSLWSICETLRFSSFPFFQVPPLPPQMKAPPKKAVRSHLLVWMFVFDHVRISRHIFWIFQRVIMRGVLCYNRQKCDDGNVDKQHLNIHVELYFVWLWIINYDVHVSNLLNGSMSFQNTFARFLFIRYFF